MSGLDLFTYAPKHWPDRYPDSPGYKARDTAQAAAQSMRDKGPRLRRQCLDQLLLHGPMTADEIADNIGVDRLSIRPRLSELSALGKVADSGERHRNASGKSAICWKVVR